MKYPLSNSSEISVIRVISAAVIISGSVSTSDELHLMFLEIHQLQLRFPDQNFQVEWLSGEKYFDGCSGLYGIALQKLP